MGIYLNPSNAGFARALRSQIYVDKSELIAYTNMVLDTEQQYVCVSRPRRFGKSMTAKMLSAYYCRTCDSEALFANLKIAKHESYKQHLNQYDVISVDMNDFLTGSSSVEMFLNTFQRAILKDLQEVYTETIDFSSENLIEVLQQIYVKTGTMFIFIIDEWDCVLRSAQNDKESHKIYLDYLRTLLKGKEYICLAYMTGILPIKKYGTHSALNMFDEFSMTDQRKLAAYTGFTEEEVKMLCNMYAMDFEETKRWYDGYRFSKASHIYNPKSVVTAMLNERFGSYWTQTESYEALKAYIEMNFDGLLYNC